MGDGLKGRRQQLFSRIAHDPAQGAIHADPPAVRAHERHADGGKLECATESLFTFAQRRFHAPAGIDVD